MALLVSGIMAGISGLNRTIVLILAGVILIGAALSGSLYLQLRFARADLKTALMEKKIEMLRADSNAAAWKQAQGQIEALRTYSKRSAAVRAWKDKTNREIEQAQPMEAENETAINMVDLWNSIVDAFVLGVRPSAEISDRAGPSH
jgi:hypothetical protein